MSLGCSGNSVGKVETWVEFLITRDIKLPYITSAIKTRKKGAKERVQMFTIFIIGIKKQN